MIYLDNAATTWPKPEAVYVAVDRCLRQGGSPGRGGHAKARDASRIVYEAREALAELFGSENSAEIIFGSNATDGMNTALFGFIEPGDRVITTSMEHNAVARPLRALGSSGVDVRVLPCDSVGRLDLMRLEQELKAGAKAVVLSHGSNVSGTIMPLVEIGNLVKAAGSVLIVDAAQTAGVEEIDVRAMNIGILAFCGHKGLLGPQGTGGLYVNEKISLRPSRYGGTGSLSESDLQPDFYPDRLESGTLNTPGIAGLLAGVRFIKETGIEVIQRREQELTHALIQGLADIPGLHLHGLPPGEGRTAVVSFSVPGNDSGEMAYLLDQEYGIACRGGLHCAPWAHRTIGTVGTGTVRLSPGFFTTDDEIKLAIAAIKELVEARIK